MAGILGENGDLKYGISCLFLMPFSAQNLSHVEDRFFFWVVFSRKRRRFARYWERLKIDYLLRGGVESHPD